MQLKLLQKEQIKINIGKYHKKEIYLKKRGRNSLMT